MGLGLNQRVRLPDGREGTICFNNLEGNGGLWGAHTFIMPANGFGDLPRPEFMLREKSIEQSLRSSGHRPDVECVGEDYVLLDNRGRRTFAARRKLKGMK